MHPLLKMIATASSDATVRIYKNRKLKNQQQFFHKFTVKQREDLDDKNTANYVSEVQEAEKGEGKERAVEGQAEDKEISERDKADFNGDNSVDN